MRRIFLFIVLLIGCGEKRHASLERFGIVVSESGNFGSFIVVGQGFAYLTKHAILRKDSSLGGFSLFFRGEVDSSAYVIATEGDVVLVRTHLGRDLEAVQYATCSYAEQVVWIQPHFSYQNKPHLYVIVGRVSRFEGEDIYLDRSVTQGISGSGVWNANGELVGMMYMIALYGMGANYGICTPIPTRLRELVATRTQGRSP